MHSSDHLLVLSGGVGGAKLVKGLAAILPPENFTVIANTGDDFEHLGFYICPDIDTLLYTLSNRSNPEQGWGVADETWSFMAAVRKLGGATWFQLGDKDLATHVIRRQLLEEGATLSEVTADLTRRFGVKVNVAPMSDDPVRTIIDTGEQEFTFQEYFVKHQCQPIVTAIKFQGAENAKPSPAFHSAINHPTLKAIIITPSNPYLSIDPILTVPGITEAIQQRAVPVIAVSPIIGGQALKGPAAKIMLEMGFEVSANGVAEHYRGLASHFIIDAKDADLTAKIAATGMVVHTTNTIMLNDKDKQELADFIVSI